MTFKKCRVCGEQIIVWDLTDGTCNDNCFNSYDKHVGIKLSAPGATPEQRQKIIGAALDLCKSYGTAKEAALGLRHMAFHVTDSQDVRIEDELPPIKPKAKPSYFEKSIGDMVGRMSEQYGFTQPEDGSEDRYAERQARQSPMRHRFWWLVHNAVAHPLIAFVPKHTTFKFHDWTSRKLHGK